MYKRQDIIGADNDYKALEAALRNKINNIERTHSGYDEYRYDLEMCIRDRSIPFQRMFPDGICRVTDSYYTKTIQFQDINYPVSYTHLDVYKRQVIAASYSSM